ncbi:signal peptide peptidase-like 2B isoform 3-T4 [Megaptera novaeangliae]
MAAAAVAAAALARLAAAFLLLAAQVACEYGMVHVVSEAGGPKGKDYCILYNPQWAHLPLDLSKAVPPGGNKTQYDEIGIPVALLSYKDMLDIFETFGRAVRAALYAPKEPMLDYNNMVIIFIMAVGTVALGGYWAGSRDVRKRYMKHKRDDGPEKHEDEAVDVTPVMICVFVVMCCSMLVLLYHFYDQLVYVIIGIFCLASSTGLYSCLSPLLQRLPFCRCRVPDNSLPYFHKRPQVRTLLLALLCLAVSVVWGVFRNEDQWAWILQDALGIAFCLYTLKTIRLPTFKACTLLLLVLFIYDVFFVFITPFLTKSGNSIMVEVATGPSDSATHEKLPMVLKVPRLNASPLALCDRPFSLLGFGDILVPGLLVAYCHRFDIQVQSSRVYFVACTIEAYKNEILGHLRSSFSTPGIPDLPVAAAHFVSPVWRLGPRSLVSLLTPACTLACQRPGSLRHRSPGDVHGAGPHAARPARPPLPGALHARHQLRPGALAQGAGHVLDGQRLCEGPTSVAVGARLRRRPAAPGGLRRHPLPAASRPRSGPVPSARGAAPGAVRARGERGRRAPPGDRDRPRPRPFGLGEGADSAPAPRNWTRAAPNLVLWSGRCARPAPARPHPGPQPCSELAWPRSPRPAEAIPARAPLPAAVVPGGGRSRHLRRWPRTRPVWCLPCCCFPSGPGRERERLWLLVEGRLCPAGPPGVWTGPRRGLGGPR